MATITVPGANHQTISLAYNGSSNSYLAQNIANTLASLYKDGQLSVTTVTSPNPIPAPASVTPPPFNELILSGAGPFNVPSGYEYVVVDGDPSVVGGTNLVAGDNDIDFTNTPGSSTSSVVAGNGNDTFNLSGNYTAAAGNGNDYWALTGSGAVSLGSGVNAVNILGGGTDTIFAATGNSLSVVNGGLGGLVYHGASVAGGTVDTIAGGVGHVTVGSGTETASFNSLVYGGANEAIYFFDPVAGTTNAVIAGAGNETLVAAASKGTDYLYGSQTPGTNDDILASTVSNSFLIGGAGTDSLVGGASGNIHDVFYILNAASFGSGVKPTDLIYNANSSDYAALLGMDTLYGGAAGSGAAAKAVSAAFASGSTSLTLKDGTTITFANTHGANGIHFTSS